MSVNKKTRERQPGSFVGRSRHILVSLLPGMSIAFLLLGWKTNPVYALGYEQPVAPQRTAYSQSIDGHYNLRFGTDKPFLPSNATTDTGQFIDPKSFPTGKVLRPLPPGGARGMASERERNSHARSDAIPRAPPLWCIGCSELFGFMILVLCRWWRWRAETACLYRKRRL